MTHENKKKTKRTSRKKDAYSDEFNNVLREIAKKNLGKSLDELMKPGSDLTDLLGQFVKITMEEEMAAHLGYESHERRYDESGHPIKGQRENTRNGHSAKTLKTSQGDIKIAIPRDRNADFEPQIVPKHGTLTADMEGKIVSLYAHGMTTRDIQHHISEMYHTDISSMFVSRVVERLEPELIAWRDRPLEAVYPVVFIDAIHQKIRHSHGIVSTAIYLVCAYNEYGKLEVLGVWAAPSDLNPKESASFWHQVMLQLQRRGVETILTLSADGLKGLENAVCAVFDVNYFLPCVVHLVRNSLIQVSWKERSKVATELREVYQASTYEMAEQNLALFEEKFSQKYPNIVRQWKENLPRISGLWKFGKELRKLVYTTNAIENVNRQIRKVTKTRGVFPNTDSALQLITLCLIERERKQDAQTKIRGDWRKICIELHFHFSESLPEQWGLRYLGTGQGY